MNINPSAMLVLNEVIIVAGFTVPLMFGQDVVLLFAIGLGMLCTYDILKLYQKTNIVHRIVFVLLISSAFLISSFLVKLVLLTFLLVLMALPINKYSVIVLSAYPIVFLNFMGELYEISNGAFLIIYAFVVTESCDSFAYLIGKGFGKTKLFKLSPNKTLEGVLGGIIISAIIGVIIGLLAEWSFFKSVVFSLTIATTTVIGDLVASKIKRFYKVKDYGNILPMHGGFLDIYDSIIFNIPIAVLLIKYLL